MRAHCDYLYLQSTFYEKKIQPNCPSPVHHTSFSVIIDDIIFIFIQSTGITSRTCALRTRGVVAEVGGKATKWPIKMSRALIISVPGRRSRWPIALFYERKGTVFLFLQYNKFRGRLFKLFALLVL